MGTEVERKFLVLDESFLKEPKNVVRVRRLLQGYPRAQSLSLRFQHVTWIWPLHVRPEEGRITIKSASPGLSRVEFEYSIPAEDAKALLGEFCGADRVRKIRVDVQHGKDTWEVDVYEDDLEGLMVCELEFHGESSEIAVSRRPPWLGPEVTNEALYYNQNLAQQGWPPDYVKRVDWPNMKARAKDCRMLLEHWAKAEDVPEELAEIYVADAGKGWTSIQFNVCHCKKCERRTDG
jgi:adenylate cyclase